MTQTRGIEELLEHYDILPMGVFESVPVVCRSSGEPEDYPDIVLLREIPQFEVLHQEALQHIKLLGHGYFRDRIPYIAGGLNEEQVRRVLAEIGFTKEKYDSFSLRKLGSNELHDFTLPATRAFFESLEIPVFRQQYGLSQPGWSTKMHRDHAHFRIHGFRAILPLNSNAYMGFEDAKGRSIIYEMNPGNLYFMNIAKMHRGFTFGHPRLALMFQMASDELIMNPASIPQKPLSDHGHIPADFLNYDYANFKNISDHAEQDA